MKKLELVLSALCLVLSAGVARAAPIDVAQAKDKERLARFDGAGTLTVGENTQVFLRYSVGRIPETGDEVVYDNGKLLRVSNGAVRGEIFFEVVTKDTSSFEDGSWYVVRDAVSRKAIKVHGKANLVLLHDASLTADGSAEEDGQNYTAGIEVLKGDSLCIFGVESGCLTAIGSECCAGIGGACRWYFQRGQLFCR